MDKFIEKKRLWLKNYNQSVINKMNNQEGDFILAGPLHSGKTDLIEEYMKVNKMHNENYLYFGNSSSFGLPVYDEEELINFMELTIFRQIYKYIFDSNQKQRYEKNNEYCDGISKQFFKDYIRDRGIDPEKDKAIREKFLSFGEMVNIGIKEAKRDGKQINVVFNHFENSRKAMVQQTLLRYGKLFDQNIIAIDEKVLAGHEEDFNKLGYSIVNLNTKDETFVKNYLDVNFHFAIMELMSKNPHRYSFTELFYFSEIIFSKMTAEIIKVSGGDLNILKSVIKAVIQEIERGGYNNTNVQRAIEYNLGRHRHMQKEAEKYPQKKLNLFSKKTEV